MGLLPEEPERIDALVGDWSVFDWTKRYPVKRVVVNGIPAMGNGASRSEAVAAGTEVQYQSVLQAYNYSLQDLPLPAGGEAAVLRSVLRSFLETDPRREELLLRSGNAPITYTNSEHDSRFGVCTCGRCGDGENRLGKTLESLRSEFRIRRELELDELRNQTEFFRVVFTASAKLPEGSDRELLKRFQNIANKANKPVALVFGGGETPAERIAEQVAIKLNWTLERHPAHHELLNGQVDYAAVNRRNTAMLETRPDLVIAVLFEEIKGPKPCFATAAELELPTYLYTISSIDGRRQLTERWVCEPEWGPFAESPAEQSIEPPTAIEAPKHNAGPSFGMI